MSTRTNMRIGLVWRGDRDVPDTAPKAESRLGRLFEAFAELGVEAEQVVWTDDAADEVRDQLLGLDGALVWVNPIQDDDVHAAWPGDPDHLERLLRPNATHATQSR